MFRTLASEWLGNDNNKDADDIDSTTAAVVMDFAHWLDTRGLTLRAPVQTHTTEAIIEDIMNYVNVSLVDEHEEDFERFLRERVFGG